MSEIIGEIAGRGRAAVLSGPSFAADVAAGLPTAVTVAAHDMDTARALAENAVEQDAALLRERRHDGR
jgi:glycerol-3-phosphate dehydrogenase (NAD(P)+)